MIISGALVLNPGVDPDAPLIGWRNIVTPSGIAADTALANYPASNLANPATFSEWRAADTSQQYITITTDGVTPLDYIGVASHNFGSALIPVSIEAFVSGAWAEVVPSAILSPDDAPAMFRFPSAATNFRIRLQSGAAPARAAVVYAGAVLSMQRKIYAGHTPLPHARRSAVSNGRSESGKFLGRIVTGAWRETIAPFSLITPNWYRANMDSFLAVANEAPFFFAWRPYSYPSEVGYGWLLDDPTPVPDAGAGNLLAFDLRIGGII